MAPAIVTHSTTGCRDAVAASRRVLLTVDARAVERGQEFFGRPLARMAGLLRTFDDREAAAVRRLLLEAHAALGDDRD
ncbi:hypothetical protein ACFWBV_26235 [Streptomyces sp. NPDC060030]|uniref:hypothetical protein n=1 Tax=Streptomyces sp. NPDC060030 TaxID=3347042 RepID=UPI0036CB0E39